MSLISNCNDDYASTSSDDIKPGNAHSTSSSANSNTCSTPIVNQLSENTKWVWLSCNSSTIDPNLFYSNESLRGKESQSSITLGDSASTYESKELDQWCTSVLNLFKLRYEKEMKEYKDSYPQAIEKGTWIKSGSAYILIKSLPVQWVRCYLELERQGVVNGVDVGKLTATYSQGDKKAKRIEINLAELACIMVESKDQNESSESNIVVLHTITLQNFKLSFNNENELEDWFCALNIAFQCIYGIQSQTSSQNSIVLWALSTSGDAYIAYSALSSDKTENKLLFQYLGGGHFIAVETCKAGVTYVLSSDNRLYVYTGGHGGGLINGITDANSQIYPITVTNTVYTYENQRWNPLTGFSSKLLLTDRSVWSDKTGKVEKFKDNFKLPSKHWQWITDWIIDYQAYSGVDKEGWQYASDFPFEYHNEKRFLDYVRRRRWYRKSQLTTNGPWYQISSTDLLQSVSLYSSSDSECQIHVWGVTLKGDVLYRYDVTTKNPKGKSWRYIDCDQSLKYISVNGQKDLIQVWAVAQDNSLLIRLGVTEHIPWGTRWLRVEQPKRKGSLCHLCTSPSSVFVIDDSGNLWKRTGMSKTKPEGSEWVKVSTNVENLSVSSDNHLWAILNSHNNQTVNHALSLAALEDNQTNCLWVTGLTSAFKYLSCRPK